MIFNLFRKKPDPQTVFAVYSAIVAQSRQERFYATWGVPDTVTGRFDMICLHLALLLRRLRSEGSQVEAFSQALFDLFFKDMDRSLRELGAGDLAVPKKIQKMGNVFYGLLAKLTEALDAGDTAEFESIIRRNVFDNDPAAAAGPLATYLLAQVENLDRQPTAAILAGQLEMEPAA